MNTKPDPQFADIIIDGASYPVPHGDISGQELRELPTPPVADLWLELPDAQDIPVPPHSTITISGDLRFFSNQPVTIFINAAPYRVPAGAITEQQLRELTSPAIPDDHRLYRDIFDDLDDPITEDEIVIITDGERFFTKNPLPTSFQIIVNGTKHTVTGSTVFFETVTAIAYPEPPAGAQLLFTVGYSRAVAPRPTGTLRAGESVTIKNGTIFNVTATDKS
ncbi:multiubiquitin domain-containing protein [Microbacterium testaceum]|uniref:multiubiquitin domain-containing protein n=1 Tax=Microbacterium testaceum TaxID=2033 RepID=UPI002AC532F6|nr:multiubiquitin domain-containing protein [Microbacterium testaceum]MDZ5146327.1 multiubiquitin domain-containing protein [Microbacterium testaceum]